MPRINDEGPTTETGSGLVTVLAMTAVVTTLIGVVLALFVTQHRFVQRDVHRTEALYRAEAAVYQALASLHVDPDWRPVGDSLALLSYPIPSGELEGRSALAPRVWARPLGGFWQLRADAQVGTAVASVRARFGERPTRHFDQALALGDTLSALTLTAEARLIGGVRMGGQGVRTAPLRGRPFRGSFQGRAIPVRDDPLPRFSARVFDETMDRLDAYLAEAQDVVGDPLLEDEGDQEGRLLIPWPSTLDSDVSDIALEAAFVDSLQVVVGRGAVSLTPEDSTLTRSPLVVLVQGDLTVTGPLGFAPGSLIAATGALSLGQDVSGREVLAYARTIEATGVSLSGQLLAREGIRLGGGSRLAYPSVVYVEGQDSAPVDEGRAQAEGTATAANAGQDAPQGLVVAAASVDGTLLYPALGGLATGQGGVVQLTGEARVRGAVYANTRTETEARLDGTLLVRQLYFYEAPATYVNWLRAGTLNRPARPDPFALPIGFDALPSLQRTTPPRYEPVAWDERITTARPDA